MAQDCDTFAEASGVLTMIDEIPAAEARPLNARVYFEPKADDPGLTDLWCLAQPIETVTPWIQGLPIAGDVFTVAPCSPDRIGEGWAGHDEIDSYAECEQTMFDAAEMVRK